MKLKATPAVGLVVLSLAAFAAVACANDYAIDFESRVGVSPSSMGKITKAASEVISGTGSFLMDTTKVKVVGYTEKFWSDVKVIKLAAEGSYTLDFDYKILSPENEGGFFFAMFRAKSAGWGHDQGDTRWTSQDGLEGHKTIAFTLEDYPDYYLLLGIHNQGKIVIDNITIVED